MYTFTAQLHGAHEKDRQRPDQQKSGGGRTSTQDRGLDRTHRWSRPGIGLHPGGSRRLLVRHPLLAVPAPSTIRTDLPRRHYAGAPGGWSSSSSPRTRQVRSRRSPAAVRAARQARRHRPATRGRAGHPIVEAREQDQSVAAVEPADDRADVRAGLAEHGHPGHRQWVRALRHRDAVDCAARALSRAPRVRGRAGRRRDHDSGGSTPPRSSTRRSAPQVTAPTAMKIATSDAIRVGFIARATGSSNARSAAADTGDVHVGRTGRQPGARREGLRRCRRQTRAPARRPAPAVRGCGSVRSASSTTIVARSSAGRRRGSAAPTARHARGRGGSTRASASRARAVRPPPTRTALR